MRVLDVAVAALFVSLSAAPAAAKEKAPKDPNKIVCRSQPDSTSRISRSRTCHTRAEWAMEDEQRRRDAEQGLEDTNHQRQLSDTYRNVAAESAATAPRD